MAIPSFYYPDLKPELELVSLPAQEAAHAFKSRRLNVGDKVRVFNGFGLLAWAQICTAERREVTLEIERIERAAKPGAKLTIATSIPKGDRQKVMLDMLTQLGIAQIIPLRCERSITKFSNNMADKWRRVMVEACKQSQNPWLPTLLSELTLPELLQDQERNFVYADADGVCGSHLFGEHRQYTILIGPEGGFSDAELQELRTRQLPVIGLGPHILRTEAAAVASAAQFNACGMQYDRHDSN